METREAIEWLKGCVVSYEVDNKGKPNGNITCDLTQEVLDMAISALEKQEQTNAQSVNSMRTSRPNALESLNILEQAKDDKGCVPMSLVRQAFRNIQEQDRWIPVTERLPEEETDVLICNADGDIAISRGSMSTESTESWIWYTSGWRFGKVTAWQPLPEPYTEES